MPTDDADDSTDDEQPRTGSPETARTAVDDPLAPALDERPTVPVFYHIPEWVADRAVARFQRRVERVREGESDARRATLRDYLYDEIDERPVIYVGSEPLGEYASEAGLGTLCIGPDDAEMDVSKHAE